MTPQEIYADHLKLALRDTERYLMISASSALAFGVFSFARMQPGNAIKWQLLGFPLEVNVPLALLFLFLIHVVSAWLADHSLLFVRDLALLLKEDPGRNALLTYPTLMSIGPAGQVIGSLAPGILVLAGLGRLYVSPVNGLSPGTWIAAACLAMAGPVVYMHILMLLGPRLKSDGIGVWLR
jgi:hypothetical protein